MARSRSTSSSRSKSKGPIVPSGIGTCECGAKTPNVICGKCAAETVGVPIRPRDEVRRYPRR